MMNALLANNIFMGAQRHPFSHTRHHKDIRGGQKRKVLVERQVLHKGLSSKFHTRAQVGVLPECARKLRADTSASSISN